MSSKKNANLSEAYLNQISVLRALYERDKTARTRQCELGEIAEASGLRDEKETQRYLYILEGHKLVSPVPAGDFTSRTWFITDDGVRAFQSISSELGLQAAS